MALGRLMVPEPDMSALQRPARLKQSAPQKASVIPLKLLSV